jgi:hypothetical protein
MDVLVAWPSSPFDAFVSFAGSCSNRVNNITPHEVYSASSSQAGLRNIKQAVQSRIEATTIWHTLFSSIDRVLLVRETVHSACMYVASLEDRRIVVLNTQGPPVALEGSDLKMKMRTFSDLPLSKAEGFNSC